jgi:hypothetical protein
MLFSPYRTVMGEVISMLKETTMTQFAQKTPRRVTLPDYLIITQAKMNRVRRESDKWFNRGKHTCAIGDG